MPFPLLFSGGQKPSGNVFSPARKMNEDIREYMRKIGAKGGRAAKGTPARIAANKRAAQARWRKVHPKPPELPPVPA